MNNFNVIDVAKSVIPVTPVTHVHAPLSTGPVKVPSQRVWGLGWGWG